LRDVARGSKSNNWNPPISGGDDFVSVCTPGEGLGFAGVVLFDETSDRGFQVVDGSEHAMFQPSSGEFGEDEKDQKTVRRTVFPTQPWRRRPRPRCAQPTNSTLQLKTVQASSSTSKG